MHNIENKMADQYERSNDFKKTYRYDNKGIIKLIIVIMCP